MRAVLDYSTSRSTTAASCPRFVVEWAVPFSIAHIGVWLRAAAVLSGNMRHSTGGSEPTDSAAANKQR